MQSLNTNPVVHIILGVALVLTCAVFTGVIASYNNWLLSSGVFMTLLAVAGTLHTVTKLPVYRALSTGLGVVALVLGLIGIWVLFN